ncbi:MAG: hypothetical protein GEEBNDBF_02556 [bacterium]|nr:hypothetical protein [bacterium]
MAQCMYSPLSSTQLAVISTTYGVPVMRTLLLLTTLCLATILAPVTLYAADINRDTIEMAVQLHDEGTMVVTLLPKNLSPDGVAALNDLKKLQKEAPFAGMTLQLTPKERAHDDTYFAAIAGTAAQIEKRWSPDDLAEAFSAMASRWHALHAAMTRGRGADSDIAKDVAAIARDWESAAEGGQNRATNHNSTRSNRHGPDPEPKKK